MRIRKEHRYLVLLAVLLALPLLVRSDLPGEEVLPEAYRAVVAQPLLAQAAVGDVQAAENDLAEARRRIRQLEDLLASTRELQGYFERIEWPAVPRAVPAWVYAVEPDAYRRTLRVSAPAGSGVERGQPVVAGKALIGRVAAARQRDLTVRRIDDESFRIEVEIETETGPVRGLAKGDGAGGMEVRYAAGGSRVERGAAAFTSAYDPQVPAGLLVGYVEWVEDVERDGVNEIGLRAAAPLDRLLHVEVLASRG